MAAVKPQIEVMRIGRLVFAREEWIRVRYADLWGDIFDAPDFESDVRKKMEFSQECRREEEQHECALYTVVSNEAFPDVGWQFWQSGFACGMEAVLHSMLAESHDIWLEGRGYGPDIRRTTAIEVTIAASSSIEFEVDLSPASESVCSIVSSLPWSKRQIGEYVGVSARKVRHWCSGRHDPARAITPQQWRLLLEMKEMADAERMLEEAIAPQRLEPGATTPEESEAIRRFIQERGVKRYRHGELITETS